VPLVVSDFGASIGEQPSEVVISVIPDAGEPGFEGLVVLATRPNDPAIAPTLVASRILACAEP